MWLEITGAHPAHEVRILGVDEQGLESGNSDMVNGRVLPWLQDSTQVNAWSKWEVTFRDVVILDSKNHKIGVYNLTVHNLGVQANYDTLKAMLLRDAR